MTQTLTAGSPTYRSKRLQMNLRASLIALQIGNFEEKSNLSEGLKVNRPTITRAKVRTYVKGVDTVAQDRTIANEYLTVDQTKEITSYIDSVDSIQSNYNLVNEIVDDDSYQLQNEIDGRFLREVRNATLSCDDGDIGGVDGNGITASTSNIIKVISKSKAIMKTGNVESNKPRNVVFTPDIIAIMEETLTGKGFVVADGVLKGGFKGNYMGVRIFESTNVCHETITTQTGVIVADDTFEIGGVTFTAKAVPSVAGEFDVGASADASYANLVLAINGTGTPSATTYIALSTADRDTLTANGVEAEYNLTTDKLYVYTSGYVAITETLSNATSTGTSSLCEMSRQGSTDIVIQKNPGYLKKEPSNKIGSNYITWDLYGIKTFQEGADRKLKINFIA